MVTWWYVHTFCVTGFCERNPPTVDGWFPPQKSSDVELSCFIWYYLEHAIEQIIGFHVIWDASTLKRRYCNVISHKCLRESIHVFRRDIYTRIKHRCKNDAQACIEIPLSLGASHCENMIRDILLVKMSNHMILNYIYTYSCAKVQDKICRRLKSLWTYVCIYLNIYSLNFIHAIYYIYRACPCTSISIST